MHKRITKSFICLLICLFHLSSVWAQSQKNIQLNWTDDTRQVWIGNNQFAESPTFKESKFIPSEHPFPIYTQQIPLNKGGDLAVKIENAQFEVLELSDVLQQKAEGFLTNEVILQKELINIQKRPFAQISMVPLRYNTQGQLERLVSFDMDIQVKPFKNNRALAKSGSNEYVNNSILNQGAFYKFRTSEEGIHRIDASFLEALGINETVSINNIRIYGNGGGTLDEKAGHNYVDDVLENAIEVVDQNNNGNFDGNDYLLFYAQAPHQWKWNEQNKRYEFKRHFYSDYTHYFFNYDIGAGKRIETINPSGQATDIVDSFDDYAIHETETWNLGESGRRWYGEVFDIVLTQDLPTFNFPNIVPNSDITMEGRFAAKAIYNRSRFQVTVNGERFNSSFINTVGASFEDPKARSTLLVETVPASSDRVPVTVNFEKSDATAEGWLDYIALNARRQLQFTGGQMSFRDALSVGENKQSEFRVGNASNATIWEITNPTEVRQIQTETNGNTDVFSLPTSTLRQFIAFDGSQYFKPEAIGEIASQNLHELTFPDMLIITPNQFLGASERLADYRRQNDGLEVLVADLDHIYNEFSSGTPDLTAIRNFVKMFYDRAEEDINKMPRFLLLMGDASYDYKNLGKHTEDANIIPTYQSMESVLTIQTFCTDDYYALLDDDEGVNMNFSNLGLDIAMGRLPVSTVEEAELLVDKIIRYNSKEALGAWRNDIAFVADDEDGNLHFRQAERHANRIDTENEAYNLYKIYCDAYPQLATPSGGRYPDVNEAIQNRIFSGSLIMNYVGHGGPTGWAEETILSQTEIQKWENKNQMPLFITATCSFSKYDDPEETSAGELLILKPDGGAGAIVTTVRLVLAGDNYDMNKAFLDRLFKYANPTTGRMPRLGEAMRIAKNDAAHTSINNRKFTLLGDPAMRLAYPEHRVVTTSIKRVDASNEEVDTIQALTTVEISGEIVDFKGLPMEDFNGLVYPVVFDKELELKTLANDERSRVEAFELRNSVIFKGKASVKNGKFSFTFVVPKDISYQYGTGRVSYYAENGVTDAHGFTENIIIGGIEDGLSGDGKGPNIQIYMNDDRFVFGGVTNPSPVLLIRLEDEDGINTVGNGIGHDLTAKVDGDNFNIIVLNEYYKSEVDNYRKGEVQYPLSDLEPGEHSIEVKAWDIHNKSGTGYTEFIVAETAELALRNVLNYPNPFFDKTAFWFEHNRVGEELTVTVQIMSLSGRVIKTIREEFVAEGFRVDHLEWDGLDEFGEPIGRGTYIYRVSVVGADNTKASKIQKLVILK